MLKQPRLIIVVNDPGFFLSHRLPIAVAARQAGYEVEIATGGGPAVSEIVHQGFVHHSISLKRRSMNPFNELGTFWSMFRLFRSRVPDVVHLVTIKPVLFGGLAARLAHVPAVVAAVTGLGPAFDARGVRASGIQWMIRMLYRSALKHRNICVVFQNERDRAAILDTGAVGAESTIVYHGSGVDLTRYRVTEEPVGPPTVLMASRLLRTKGVLDFAAAAKAVSETHPGVRFWLAGTVDRGSPDALSQDQLNALRNSRSLELLGHRNDVHRLLEQAHIVVHPSQYLEGLPRVLAEAAACSRAVVTTDVPGCRDAIEANITGLLSRPGDVASLTDAIVELLDDPARRRAMGLAGRRLAETKFDVQKIAAQHVDLYDRLRLTTALWTSDSTDLPSTTERYKAK